MAPVLFILADAGEAERVRRCGLAAAVAGDGAAVGRAIDCSVAVLSDAVPAAVRAGLSRVVGRVRLASSRRIAEARSRRQLVDLACGDSSPPPAQ